MACICLADGEPTKPEADFISTFSKLIGVTEQQQSQILAEVKERISRDSVTIPCPGCSRPAAAQARFCSDCGTALQTLQKENPAPLSIKLPDAGFAIEFAETLTGDFSAALEKAKAAFSYQTCLKDGKKWHVAIFNGEDFPKAAELADLLKGQKNKRFYINGREADWETVFGFSRCASQRNQAYKPAEHCFGKDEKKLNLWGCKQIRMDWVASANWFTYGSFKQKGFQKNFFVWKFDKKRILHEINAHIRPLKFCPYLNIKLIEAVLESLPDEVEISQEKPGPWKFKRAHEQLPGAVKVIEERNHPNGERPEDDFFAIGVEPADLNIARNILQMAFSKCGISEISANELIT
jgi:hypothetical protein